VGWFFGKQLNFETYTRATMIKMFWGYVSSQNYSQNNFELCGHISPNLFSHFSIFQNRQRITKNEVMFWKKIFLTFLGNEKLENVHMTQNVLGVFTQVVPKSFWSLPYYVAQIRFFSKHLTPFFFLSHFFYPFFFVAKRNPAPLVVLVKLFFCGIFSEHI